MVCAYHISFVYYHSCDTKLIFVEYICVFYLGVYISNGKKMAVYGGIRFQPDIFKLDAMDA